MAIRRIQGSVCGLMLTESTVEDRLPCPRYARRRTRKSDSIDIDPDKILEEILSSGRIAKLLSERRRGLIRGFLALATFGTLLIGTLAIYYFEGN